MSACLVYLIMVRVFSCRRSHVHQRYTSSPVRACYCAGDDQLRDITREHNGAGVARSCRTLSKTAAVIITAKSAGRKVFGLATAGVRLA